jgi:transketolase
VIEVKTILGYKSKYANTNAIHGKVLKNDEIAELRKKLNVTLQPFQVVSL